MLASLIYSSWARFTDLLNLVGSRTEAVDVRNPCTDRCLHQDWVLLSLVLTAVISVVITAASTCLVMRRLRTSSKQQRALDGLANHSYSS